MLERQSPYLAHQSRLADVISAIQVMGTYRYSARSIESWSEILGEKPRSADTWLTVFNEHPEFFRAGLDEEGLHTLVVRRAHPRTFNTKTLEEISRQEYQELPKDGRSHISRKPLSTEQILALIEVAIKLQAQAAARRQELRWWVPIVITALSALTGALIGASVAK